jgi:hypothetical protein
MLKITQAVGWISNSASNKIKHLCWMRCTYPSILNLAKVLAFSLLLSACDESLDRPTQSSQGQLIITKTHGDQGNAWGKGDCDTCHAIKTLHKNASAIIKKLSNNKGYQACTGCHGENGTEEKRQCLICHNHKDLPTLPLSSGNKVHHLKGEKSTQLTDEECITCHQASDMNGQFELNTDLTQFKNKAGIKVNYKNEAEFCQRCHNRNHQQTHFSITDKPYNDPLIAIEDNYQYFDFHGFRNGTGEGTYNGLRSGYNYQQLVNCTDCHALHGTHNNQLIIDSSAKGVRALADNLRHKPYMVNTDGANGTVAGDYGQLCVLCHQMNVINDHGAEDTGNGLSGVHEVKSDCRDCHTHGEAIQIGL